jgi:21S rRNA (GM2251-2'-O)-methyltransferase
MALCAAAARVLRRCAGASRALSVQARRRPTLRGFLAPKGEFVYGHHPVLSALLARRRTALHALYLQDEAPRDEAARRIVELARELGVPVHITDKHDLNLRAEQRPHNGVVLDAAPFQLPMIDSLADALADGGAARPEPWPHSPVLVAVDGLTDPQNLGNILRSSFFFGADAVLLAEHNTTGLSPLVSKASSGAMEWLRCVQVRNMARLFERASRERVRVAAVGSGGSLSSDATWARVALTLDAEAAPCRDASLEALGPLVLAVGSEGHGLRPGVLRHCTHRLRIDGALTGDRAVLVDSLNVSNAVAAVLFQLLGKRRQFKI